MKGILLISLLLGSILFADKIAIPMPASSLAIENSGQLSAIDAYQDGVGIYTVEQIGSAIIDNSEMNSLVYKYGAEAKAAGVNVKDYIFSSGNAAEKVLAGGLGKFEPITPGNGTVCNDNNILTSNDKYFNGICSGINNEGQTCNDSNAQTINDKYVLGICIGTNVENQVCNDNNAQTINDKYINGLCVGTNIENQVCNDDILATINDKYVNGVCGGTYLSYTKAFTLPDAYPANNTNWSVVSSTHYISTGQFSAKFLTLPTSGKVKIEVELGSIYVGAGISIIPVTNTWGNMHIGPSSSLPYTLATWKGRVGAYSEGAGIYNFYLDLDSKNGQIIKQSNGKIISTFTFSAGDLLGIEDYASAGTGYIKILSAYKN